MAGLGVVTPPDSLATAGIGSCVAVCLYDPINKIGGLAHIMLPVNTANDLAMPAKYADTGLAALIAELGKRGAVVNGLTAKIAGGASVLTPAGERAAITVGKNNLERVTAILESRGIRILARDTGGTFGRNIVFHTVSGAMDVTVYSQPVTRKTL